ncbi:GNAT family N-acetyltransferase [Cytobacillus oceanisediminis]|uniref:GNAT family N-acetyltransferase n=1 Tax=Niallia alba TaxID=2729105 RepID=A0A7Y0K8P5_9BACI|nr:MULTISPECIES: GNAT family N-acetyltransferase [Bacillaceae]MBQ6449040.1 GNAT family N-acetyltransferase [Bacillus sp. (in: firmicutes)]MBZ9536555.1 GNAT family N-acetyltransferase [Cytobacillus oceanisediminis]NMO77593.1 GNAT family N-acetyltransferase [Niallia alba]
MTIRWEEITYDNLTNIEKVFEIYDEAFPIEVREPQDIFYQSLDYAKTRLPNGFRFLVGYEGEQLVSFATGHYFAEANIGFIVYIATNPLIRSKGLGTKTLVKIEELLNEDAISAGNVSLRATILETEKQEIVHNEAEKEDCIKRNRFFERNGYKKIDEIQYIQPPLNNGDSNVPLNLFINKNDVSKEEIIKYIQIIYKEKYCFVNRIDKQVLKSCLEMMGIENVHLPS